MTPDRTTTIGNKDGKIGDKAPSAKECTESTGIPAQPSVNMKTASNVNVGNSSNKYDETE